MPRTPRVTVAQVARAAGVSPMTVSYAFNRPDRVATATRSHVVEVAARLGWSGPNPAARSLRAGRVGTVGVVLSEPLTYAFQDLQAARFLAGVAGVCGEEGLGLTLLAPAGPGGSGGPNGLPGRGSAVAEVPRVAAVEAAVVDAFLLWTQPVGDPVLAAVARTGVPAGVLGGPRVPGMACVSIDDRAAARAVAGVVFAGARAPVVLALPLGADPRPALLTGPDPERLSSPVARHRLAGAYDGWLAIGGDRAQVRVAVAERNTRGAAHRVAAGLLAGPDPPDAVLAMSDELALGVLAAAHEVGVGVPGRLAVSGFDGSDAATAAGLTTVEQSLSDQGRALARTVLDARADGPGAIAEPRWDLVRRSSTR